MALMSVRLLRGVGPAQATFSSVEPVHTGIPTRSDKFGTRRKGFSLILEV